MPKNEAKLKNLLLELEQTERVFKEAQTILKNEYLPIINKNWKSFTKEEHQLLSSMIKTTDSLAAEKEYDALMLDIKFLKKSLLGEVDNRQVAGHVKDVADRINKRLTLLQSSVRNYEELDALLSKNPIIASECKKKEELLNKDASTARAENKQPKYPLTSNLNFQALFITAVQRGPRYEMLTNGIAEAFRNPDDKETSNMLDNAASSMRMLNKTANSLVTIDAENKDLRKIINKPSASIGMQLFGKTENKIFIEKTDAVLTSKIAALEKEKEISLEKKDSVRTKNIDAEIKTLRSQQKVDLKAAGNEIATLVDKVKNESLSPDAFGTKASTKKDLQQLTEKCDDLKKTKEALDNKINGLEAQRKALENQNLQIRKSLLTITDKKESQKVIAVHEQGRLNIKKLDVAINEFKSNRDEILKVTKHTDKIMSSINEKIKLEKNIANTMGNLEKPLPSASIEGFNKEPSKNLSNKSGVKEKETPPKLPPRPKTSSKQEYFTRKMKNVSKELSHEDEDSKLLTKIITSDSSNTAKSAPKDISRETPLYKLEKEKSTAAIQKQEFQKELENKLEVKQKKTPPPLPDRPKKTTPKHD